MRIRTGERYKYHNFNFDPDFCTDTPTLKTTFFATLPPREACKIGNTDNSYGVMGEDTTGRGTNVTGISGVGLRNA
ncbi:hypothetical protein [Barnesiella intestinihominis]|uniref:hypothetical protein n=1 Tax=Barnesiella intestinihominis TaxID=487174 RepID=UPI0020477670|nr:MAG TPA: hypothetical protein [Caudoviricetes sp.]